MPATAQLLRHMALLPAEAVIGDLVEAADLDGPIDVEQTAAADALGRYVWSWTGWATGCASPPLAGRRPRS